MRVITAETEARWKAHLHGGNARPTVRATIEPGQVRVTPYKTANAPGGDYDRVRDRTGRFRNIVFGNATIREIRNIRRCDWGRSVDQDIAECTLTLLNTDLTPIGNADETAGSDFELPGLFTFNRGDQTVSANRWGYSTETGWNGQFVPDRLVRTYEGWGFDDTVAPGDDPNLYQSGTWLIDSVKYDAGGDLVLEMRDLARLLVDHVAFPPVVPHDDYPLHWSRIDSVMLPGRVAEGGEWGKPLATVTSSNDKYVGAGIVDNITYVNSKGGVLGHYPNHAYRNEDDGRYWMSTGQTSYDDTVWWQVHFRNPQAAVGAVRIRARNAPYKVYISIQDGDGWVGRRDIPYEVTTEGVDLEAGIPYVKSMVAEKSEPVDVTLPRKYKDVRRIRLTFTRLRRPIQGLVYPWRATLTNFEVYTAKNASDMSFGMGEKLTPVGNYRDYTDIIKWVGAWAGFWWPDARDNFIKYSTGGPEEEHTYAAPDPVLPGGRVWGSFQKTGTSGIADLTPDLFDKQPLLDVIQYVRDITGFSFWVDECGGLVWRMPNLYSLGNYITPSHKDKRRRPTRTTDVITIDENETLLNYSTTLNSRNMRERVFVANSTGKFGTVVKGFTPYPTGLMRIAGWTDQHWKTARECRIAADMVVARQMFDYRRASVKIPGNPAIQADDQIRIFERTTNETYYHYVLGVSSSLDMEEGTWTYDLETHWLGERPSDAWAVRVDQLDGATQAYLNTIGEVE